MVRRKR
jgi:hypothetical protein